MRSCAATRERGDEDWSSERRLVTVDCRKEGRRGAEMQGVSVRRPGEVRGRSMESSSQEKSDENLKIKSQF